MEHNERMNDLVSEEVEDLRHTYGFEEDEEIVKMANILWRVHRETLPPKGGDLIR